MAILLYFHLTKQKRAGSRTAKPKVCCRPTEPPGIVRTARRTLHVSRSPSSSFPFLLPSFPLHDFRHIALSQSLLPTFLSFGAEEEETTGKVELLKKRNDWYELEQCLLAWLQKIVESVKPLRLRSHAVTRRPRCLAISNHQNLAITLPSLW